MFSGVGVTLLPPGGLGKGALRPKLIHFVSLPVMAGFAWLLAQKLAALDLSDVGSVISEMPAGLWCLAIGAAALSFGALGRYDALMHRTFRTGIPAPRAARAGMRAIAIGQFAGFGLISSGLARWRLLPELSLSDAARVTAAVGASFMLALVACIGGILAFGPITDQLPDWTGRWAAPCGAALLFAMIAAVAYLRGRGHVSAKTAGLVLFWVLLDTGFAAASLWVFLPEGVGFALVYCAYVLALGAGLVSNAPGGIGPFELTLMALLPSVPPEALISAVLAHRLCYYLLPATLALPRLVVPSAPCDAPLFPVRAADHAPVHPDWGLAHQGARILARAGGRGAWLARPALGYVVGIGTPAAPATHDDLWQSARRLGRLPLAYKIDARSAARARRAGNATVRIAREAVLIPADWSLKSPARSQLRRKLRQAEKAGITVRELSPEDHADALSRLNADWRAAHGGERGFSMGRFELEYLKAQRVVGAFVDQDLVAFVSFNVNASGWGLDLIRYGSGAPHGASQALIAAGIELAKAEQAPLFSLAAVPCGDRLPGKASFEGLIQFKSSFGPDWRPLYAAAPSWPTLLLGLAATGLAVHRPHDHPEPFAFELRPAPCDGPSDAVQV